MLRFTNSTLTYNRSAILRAAWARARNGVTACAKMKLATTLRAEFCSELRRVWNEARQERGFAVWNAERAANAAAENARRETLPIRDRQIEDASTALMFAEHNDTYGGHRLVAECRARLTSLQHAA